MAALSLFFPRKRERSNQSGDDQRFQQAGIKGRFFSLALGLAKTDFKGWAGKAVGKPVGRRIDPLHGFCGGKAAGRTQQLAQNGGFRRGFASAALPPQPFFPSVQPYHMPYRKSLAYPAQRPSPRACLAGERNGPLFFCLRQLRPQQYALIFQPSGY